MKRFKSFKEELTETVKKIVLLILAVAMLYFFLPIGIVPEPDFTDESGEVIRISPYEEVYSNKDDDSTIKIDGSNSVYCKFNLQGLSEVDVDDINSAKMRLTFLKNSPGMGGKVTVAALPAGVNPDKVPYIELFSEKELGTAYPQTTGKDDSLCLIDITDFIKDKIDKEINDVVFRVSSEDALLMADSSYDDPVYRPCISIATGVATDTEIQSLERTVLKEAVYISESEPDKKGVELANDNILEAGDGRNIYLRFDINTAAILGSPYNVELSLDKLDSKKGRVRIYCINNNEWDAGEISYNNRPRGNEVTAYTALSSSDKTSGRIRFDVTQAVCEAIEQGVGSLTFRIECDEKIKIAGGAENAKAPQLYINVSDDKEKVCASAAALSALGSNKASFVTMNLLREYTSVDESDAKIKWTEYTVEGKKNEHTHISSDGTVTRPKWFEGNRDVLAVAEIRCGKYKTQRQYRLSIPAEAAPDLSKYEFTNYLDIGEEKSENSQKLEYVNTSGSKRRWVAGRMFTYRVMENGGMMVLNFSCMPDLDNYLTLKLWEGDSSYYSDFVVEVCDKNNSERLVMTAPTHSEESESGFVYATYALPGSFTAGKSQVSLRLSYDKSSRREISERGLYAAYLTQSSYFEPKQFTQQGEKSISEPRFGEQALEKFINNLKSLAIPIGIEPSEDEEELNDIGQIVDINIENGSVVFVGNEANIAFSINEKAMDAVIYQKLEYYDRYSRGCRVYDSDGVVTVDYGDYKMIWNKTSQQKVLPLDKLELSGSYKEVVGGVYYSFSDNQQITDDSVIPDDEEVLSGYDMVIEPESAILLAHVADPMQASDWRVSHINGRNVADLEFGSHEKIESVKIKSIGGIAEKANEVTVIFAIYDDEKIVAMGRRELPVIGSIGSYSADMSSFDMYMKKGNTLRVFIYDDTESPVNIKPKLEMP